MPTCTTAAIGIDGGGLGQDHIGACGGHLPTIDGPQSMDIAEDLQSAGSGIQSNAATIVPFGTGSHITHRCDSAIGHDINRAGCTRHAIGTQQGKGLQINRATRLQLNPAATCITVGKDPTPIRCRKRPTKCFVINQLNMTTLQQYCPALISATCRVNNPNGGSIRSRIVSRGTQLQVPVGGQFHTPTSTDKAARA